MAFMRARIGRGGRASNAGVDPHVDGDVVVDVDGDGDVNGLLPSPSPSPSPSPNPEHVNVNVLALQAVNPTAKGGKGSRR
jgi:hypothetical protein